MTCLRAPLKVDEAKTGMITTLAAAHKQGIVHRPEGQDRDQRRGRVLTSVCCATRDRR
jgi:hypothetical protein